MLSRLPHALVAVVAISWYVSRAVAQEPLSDRIDHLIAVGVPDYAKHAAPPASDAEFFRRVHLDLTGRLPTTSATRAFLAEPIPTKRLMLIDHLLAGPAFARRLQEYFDAVLMDRRRDVKVPRAAWAEYLRASFAAGKSYDQLVREILSTDGADPKTRPAAKFLLDRDLDPTVVTRDISRLFLGRNLQCAQCHDHPLVEEYKQAHFYGIQAFFNRAFLYPNAQDANAVIAEKAEGEVTFTSVFDPNKVSMTTAPKVLAWQSIADPKAEKGKEYKVAPAKGVKPVPAYSRFAQLGAAVAAADNLAFRRTAANRVWAFVFGRGLVHPLDYDHEGNPASHPALLNLLADELANHKFDLKWLVREIVRSETYQRSSGWTADTPPEPEKYLAAPLKPLDPEQFAHAILQATGHTDSIRTGLPKGATENDLHTKVAGSAAPIVAAFSSVPGEPAGEFASTLDQTLFVKHGGHVRNLIAPRAGNLLDRALKLTDPNAVADELYLSVFTRPPTTEEAAEVADALRGVTDRKAVLTEIVWAMLASAEFRFNH